MENSKAKILLIEDDPFLLKMYSVKFEINGYNVFSASDGRIGLDLAREIIPDIILLDIMMPRMNGFEVLRGLKLNNETIKIPVVLLTNTSTREDMEMGLSLGASDYFIKAHFIPSEIVGKVEDLLIKKINNAKF